MENPYKILNITPNSSIDDVKKAYKNIALKSHPDKLNNISIEEKNIKIKEFMNATDAYNKILNKNVGDDDYLSTNPDDWIETFNNIMNSHMFKEMVNLFMKYKSRAKKHNISVDIKYSDYYSTTKKKLRIFLKNIEEPIYIDLDCSKFPKHTINYFDDNENEHEILINMILAENNNNGYYHIYDNDGNNGNNDNNDNNGNDDANNNGKINIIYELNIDTVDYIIGNTKEHIFLNKELIHIIIEPFSDCFIKKGYGINKGDFIVNFNYNPIKKENWDKLSNADKNEMVRIFKILKNDIKL